MLEQAAHILSETSRVLWGVPLLVILGAAHVFLTFRLRFIQRHIGTAIKLSFLRAREGAGEISHFGALSVALAATIGTGNIVGVATAVALGGPGAVLWMWLTGVFGIATKYSEALLSIKYRVAETGGAVCGGPMYVLERGMNCRWLGIVFAVLTALAAFGIGNTVQANAISRLLLQTTGVSPWVTGAVLTAMTGVVILGGIRSLARACALLVPFMALFYMFACMVLLAMHIETVPQTIYLIVTSAFTGQAAVGGFAGAGMMQALRWGMARGLFSNESGLGSAPIVAAAAQTKNPVRQALISATGTFWDTVVVCALTGLVIVNSGAWTAGQGGDLLTKQAFGAIPVLGPFGLTIALFTFVFSTLLGWSYYGEKSIEYLLGSRAVKPYRWLWVGAVFAGSVSQMQMVWDFADIANALMAVPNIISLFVLSPVIVAETRKYLWEGRLEESGE